MSTLELSSIAENALLNGWGALLDRHPDQLNQLHEADAELIPLPASELLLAITIDTVAEEIALGFYREPGTIGWMGATASLSDLAAVGATPLGLVTSVSLPADSDAQFREELTRGLAEACRQANTFVLGGDTNFAAQPEITGCAVGLVDRSHVIQRTGANVGDMVYVTGRLGAGAAAAARAVIDLPAQLYAESDYRPLARLKEGAALAASASACMDTSDGLITTLDQLARLNQVGFLIEAAPADLLEPKAAQIVQQLQLPPLAMLSALHGEFELVYTVAPDRQQDFVNRANDCGGNVIPIGTVVEELGVHLAGSTRRTIDTTRIRNLLEEVGGDLPAYLQGLLEIVA